MQNNNITFDVKVISFIVLFISILFAIDANAQKDSHFKSTYNEQITITYDGNERIVTITTKKDGKTETKILKGEEADKYIEHLGSSEIPDNDIETPMFKHYKNRPHFNFDFDFGFNSDEWVKRMEEEFKSLPPDIKGFTLPTDRNGFFFGFKNDTSFWGKNFDFFDFFNNESDYNDKYENFSDTILNYKDKFIKKPNKNIEKITKFIRFEDYSDKSENVAKMGISGLQLIPYPEDDYFILELYNKTNKPININVTHADGTYIFGQTFPGSGHISCIINISPKTSGVWYINISKGRKVLMKRLIIS
jgi:hypothetical protein